MTRPLVPRLLTITIVLFFVQVLSHLAPDVFRSFEYLDHASTK